MTCAIIGAFLFFTHRPYYIYNQTVKKLRFFADLLAFFRRLYLFFADYQLVMVERFRITLQR